MGAAVFLKSMLLGLAIAAPVGPIGLLCIQRTLVHGRAVGFASGLGAATADGCYGALGAFGLAAVTQALAALRLPLAVAGALLLGGMGVQMMRAAAPTAPVQAPGRVNTLGAYASVVALTLANPMTILSFAAVFATLGGRAGVDPAAAALMVAGVFLGSAAWWLTLAAGVHALRHRLGAPAMRWINRIAGALLLAFALRQLARAL